MEKEEKIIATTTSASIFKTPTPIKIDDPKETYLPMLHGKATDAIASMAGQPLEKNKITNTASITRQEVKLVLDTVTKLAGTLGVSTHKLLSTAIANFTANNHTGSGERKLRTLEASFPLKEYAFRCGYDVKEHETHTPEEVEKEKKRAKNALDKARKKVNKDLNILYRASISWKEKVRGKEQDYEDVRIIQGKGIRTGIIKITFSNRFAEYLLKLPLTQYPPALLGIDERNQNAYTMALKMSEHFNLDNNQRKGTAQLLKVKTLLQYTSFPDVNHPTVKKTGWKARIKEPFEIALDALTACGLLEQNDGWYYCKSKGIRLTDEEAYNFISYENWAETLIHFTLIDAPNHTARLEAKELTPKQIPQRKKGKQ